MAFLREISVDGLFGLYDHGLQLRRDPPVTIVSGPNGIGKTTLLALTNALLNGSYRTLALHNFRRLTVSSDSGASVTATHVETKPSRRGPIAVLDLELRRPRRDDEKTRIEVTLEPELPLPSWIHPTSEGLFYDERNETFSTREEMVRRYSRLRGGGRQPDPAPPEWFAPEEWATEFIETKRLDSLLARGLPPERGRDDGRPPIHFYLDAVREAMGGARDESSSIAQGRDRTFASRLLDPASRAPVKEAQIRERYSEVEQSADELRGNGLLVDSLEVLPDSKLKPTDRWVLRLFLEDFEAKLAPLRPVSGRLNLMRAIVDAKFLNKHMDVDRRSGIVFLADEGNDPIRADALSSGEQHEIALMSRLLFSIEQDSTVLVDEPELSLHVSWQHRMLDDLEQIADLVGLRIVLATHSTAIINGRWDLVEELGAIDDTQAAGGSSADAT